MVEVVVREMLVGSNQYCLKWWFTMVGVVVRMVLDGNRIGDQRWMVWWLMVIGGGQSGGRRWLKW